MELNFDRTRLLLLAACLAVFALLGGFVPPESGPEGYHQSAALSRAWVYSMALFVAGAISVSLIEHTVGYMDPTNLRPAYIVLGAGMMIAAVVWLLLLKQGVERTG